MRSYIALAVVGLATLAGAGCSQQTPLQKAAALLGTEQVKTLQFVGSGKNFSVGQNYTSTDPWPEVTVKSYTGLINFETGSARVEMVREMGAVMPKGGGAPFFGEQRQVQAVSGDYAWNVPAMAGAPAAPNPDAQPERMLAIWTTPTGFVKGAIANNATSTPNGTGADVSFMVGGKYKVEGTINEAGQVEKVRTWIDHPIVGDMLIETTYSDYKDVGGGAIRPTHLVVTQDGFPSLDLTLSSVTLNPAADIVVPDNVKAFQPPPVNVTADKLANGVFYLKGGTHHSFAIEMTDHIVVVDTPNNQARAEAVLAKAKEVIPNKPIRYVVTSHHHWDHLGGIRAAIAEGATIVTHESNKAFIERVATTTHSIRPDRQSEVKNAAKVETVGDDGQLTDGKRVIELHRLQGYDHTGDMTVVYLPADRILGEPDAFTPLPMPGAALIPPAVPSARALADNIKRLKLNVRTIAPFHGNRLTDVAELERAANPTVGTN
jgi:glyoxylase-like metal-dependent hydrolase (beta-lactamase superfamily II)